MTRSLSTMLFVLLAATAGAQADHLQCFKIRDTIAKTSYTATLAPTDAQFPVAPNCVVHLPAKLLCVDVVKTIVPPPTPPGAGPGLPAQKYLCYKVKCPKATPSATIQDQFGVHQVTVKGTSLLCAPEPAPTTSTTTTTTTTTSTTTTTMAGCVTNGQCPGAPNAMPLCQGGMCTFTCDPGFADCDLNPANGCEVDTNTSVTNCGGCGMMCGNANGTPACTAGHCTITCFAGFADCDMNPLNGCEVNTQTSPFNCGSCGNACAAIANGNPGCSGGTCHASCNAGFADCDMVYANGCEVNTTNSNTNCGSCGHVCSGGTPNCLNSVCSP
jgi:hypothetical protein